MPSDDLVKVRFLETRILRDGAGEITDNFEKGETYDLPRPSAVRWIRRHAAVAVKPGEADQIKKALEAGPPMPPVETAVMEISEAAVSAAAHPTRRRR